MSEGAPASPSHSALGSFVPSVLEHTGFCLCAEWNFSFCSCAGPLSQTVLHLTGRLCCETPELPGSGECPWGFSSVRSLVITPQDTPLSHCRLQTVGGAVTRRHDSAKEVCWLMFLQNPDRQAYGLLTTGIPLTWPGAAGQLREGCFLLGPPVGANGELKENFR